MAILERVSTLVRANLNDLIDRAEDPEKMIKQVILDMENQLLQVKTQVAISMADQHLLQKKRTEHQDRAAEWMRKAELAVDKHQDDLARAMESATDAQLVVGGRGPAAGFDRMEQKVHRSEAISQAKSTLIAEDVDSRFEAMEKEDEVGRLLDALKARRGASPQ
jgi:phage shock protein A